MIFPSPGWRHPIHCFWVACWNTIETFPAIVPAPLTSVLPPWLFGKVMGAKGTRIR